MQFKYRPLKWSDYAQCRQICQDNFDPSRLPVLHPHVEAPSRDASW
jgi:hypothetical protein